MKKVTKMNNEEAKKFFLKGTSYSNVELPVYFNFQKILNETDLKIQGKNITDFYKNKKKKPPKSFEKVNYEFLNNKDGKYAWRPFSLIHPVLYVALVQEICDSENWKVLIKRFKDYRKNSRIICCSIPGESKSKRYDKKSTILNWWNMYEQKSISLSLEYNYMGMTDISNCYSSIYTHSIPWAIYGKDEAKKIQNRQNNELIGNKIDNMIREMCYGQTNGIPQGSVLMDFIAEIIFGYADELLSFALKDLDIVEYKILRYRDDYRIFTNNSYELDIILKKLSEILSSLNLKLNSQKTYTADDIITCSIKKDKMERISNIIENDLNFQKQLLIIRSYGIKYPNCGTLAVLLTKFYHENIKNLDKKPHNMEQIISILVDIMLKNPRTYSICVAILSKMFEFMNESTKFNIIEKILTKFEILPNTDYLNIWLQRLTILDKRDKEYNTLLCQKLYKDNEIWESKWLNYSIDEKSIIDEKEINKMSKTVSEEEVNAFFTNYE